MEDPVRSPVPRVAVRPHSVCPTPGEHFVPVPVEAVHRSVQERFEEQAALHADRIAVKDDRDTMTYDALNRLANRLARAIREQAGGAPEPVALVLEHGAPALAAILGVLKADKFYVPADPWAPPARIRHVLEDSGARLVVLSARTEARVAEALPDGLPRLRLDALPPDLPDTNLGLRSPPDQPVAILYTSGSTGRPKGVLRTHRTSMHSARLTINSYGMGPDDRVGVMASYSVAAGAGHLFSTLLSGAGLYAFDLPRHGIARIADWLDAERITFFRTVPTVFRNFLTGLDPARRFPHVRMIGLGGETIYPSDVALFRAHFRDDCLLRLALRATEAGGAGADLIIDKRTPIPDDIVPAGYATEDAEILIVDDAGNPLGPERTGEIVFKSRYLSPGYWNQPELTAQRFRPVPGEEGMRLYFTGDLGRLSADGCLYHLGRKDFQAKVRGHRIELPEVERALMRLPGVDEAAAAVRDDGRGDSRLVGYVVCGGQRPPTVSELRAGLAATLPQYMIPGAFVYLDRLPTLPASAKVDRAALPAPGAERPPQAVSYLAPRDDLERRLADLWKDVLGVESVGVRDNFFDLGGHSLRAAELFARIEQTFARRLPLRTLLRAPTVETLAAVIEMAPKTSESSCLIPLQAGSARPPFFCIPGAAVDVITFAPLAQALGPDQPFYAIQAVGLDGAQTPHTTVAEMADHYIAEVRALQPEGPYLLGGRCFGGFVAYEMACRLVEQGHRVGLLALLDSSQPPPMTTLWSHAAQLLAHHLPRGQFWYCVAHDVKEEWRKLRKRLFGKRESAHLRRVWSAHTQARRNWTPRPYPGPVSLYQSAEFCKRFPDYLARWRALAAGGLEVHAIPGGHFGMLSGERLAIVARDLRAEIERARPGA